MNGSLFLFTSFFILISWFIALHRYRLSKNVQYFIINSIILIIGFLVLYKYFYIVEIPIAKGVQGNTGVTTWITIGLCFIAMIFGMICHSMFFYYILPKEDRDKVKKDWGKIIAPICVSPIVFIPIVTLLQNAKVDLMNPSYADITLFLIAFENGFFWKEIFNNRMTKE